MAGNPWATCPRCGAPRQGQERFCPRCGLDYWSVPPDSSLSAGQAAPATTPPPPQAVPKGRRPVSGGQVFLIILVLGGIIFVVGRPRGDGDGGSSRTPTPAADQDEDEPNRNLVGRFIEWEAVDDAHGYAYFEIENTGSSAATAECTIRVSNDFGNFGFDVLVGERVPAGDTISGRIPLDVGEGSFQINKGEVTDC